MKKVFFLIIFLMIMIPYFVNAETCNSDKIYISSITLKEKSENVKEIEEASANGKIINLNLSMSEVGDNLEYEIVVKNNSNDDFELDKNSFNISSNYIDYTFESEDNSNIVKANSNKKVYLKIKYIKEVPNEVFENDTYNDNKSIIVNLLNEKTDTNINPNTGVNLYVLLFAIIIFITTLSYIILSKKRYSKIIILIIGIVIIIPISINALCNPNIEINSKIMIKKEYLYTISINHYSIGDLITDNREFSHNYEELLDYIRIVLKHEIKQNKISSSYVGFYFNNNIYYLRGGVDETNLTNHLVYENNKKILFEALGKENCNIDSSNNINSNSKCTECRASLPNSPRYYSYVCDDGWVIASCHSPGCEIKPDGSSFCYME